MPTPRKIPSATNPPTEDEISALLKSVKMQPRSRFYEKIKQAPWFRASTKKNQNRLAVFPLRYGIAAVLTFIALFSLVSAFPSLKTNASRLFQFFSSFNEDRRSIEPKVTPTSITAPLPETQFPLSLAEAQEQAGFTPKEITLLPEKITFDGSAFSSDRQALILHYTDGETTILLTQRKADVVQEYASIGPAATVEGVMLHGLPAEYVTGGWVVEAVSSSKAPSSVIYLVWDDQSTMRTFRWQENGYIFEIVTNSPESFSLTEILAIAESVR